MMLFNSPEGEGGTGGGVGVEEVGVYSNSVVYKQKE